MQKKKFSNKLKITDKYNLFKEELKQSKDEYNKYEDIRKSYVNAKIEFSDALFNLTNNINNLKTFLSSVFVERIINENNKDNDDISTLFNKKKTEINKYSDEYISYLHNINNKVMYTDVKPFEQMITEEISRLNNNRINIQDKLKIIENMLSISINDSVSDEEVNLDN